MIQRLEHTLLGQVRQVQLACIERAEMLAFDIEASVQYPEDWVAFRVGGVEVAPEGGLISGTDLLADLGPLVERLCNAAKLGNGDATGGECVDSAALCARWNISRSTLDRLRGRGLIGRRVRGVDGRPRVLFRLEVVRRFEEARQAELSRAGSFTRISEPEVARLVKRAERYRRLLGWTLNQSAERLAKRFGRSHEGIRQLLQRAAQQGHASLRQASVIDEDKRDLLFRAWRRGVDLSLISRRTRRSRGAVRRAINLVRAQRLRTLLESGVLTVGDPPALSKRGGIELLAQMPVRTGLASPFPTDVLGLLKAARTQGPPIGAEEKARLAAYQHLRVEAAGLVGRLDRLQPSAVAIDRAETHLRWAARLKAELIRSQFRLMLDTLAARIPRPLEELPPATLVQVLIDGIRAIGDAVDAHDPSKAGRLAAAASLQLDRYAVALAKTLVPTPSQARRAMVVISSSLQLPDWERDVGGWQALVEPDRRLRAAIGMGRIPAKEAGILSRRYGWDGGPPRTLGELAAELKMSSIRMFQVEHRALATGLRALRASSAALTQ